MTAPSSGRPLKVVGFADSTDRRGAEMFASGLSTRLRDEGFDFEVYAMRRGAQSDGLDFTVLGGGRTDPRMWWRAYGATKGADVLVAFGGPALLMVALLGLVRRCPFVYRQIGDPSFWGNVRLASLRIGWPLRRAAAVVALWSGAGDELVRRYGLAPARVSVIPNARDGERYRPPSIEERVDARAALAVGPDPVLVYLGSLSYEKRPADAIEICALVPGSVLLVAGGGPLQGELENLATERAPGRVRFLGVVADPVPVLHAADLLVCPSATEGMAGCLLEAALTGLPVVATEVGAAGEVVDQGGTGALAAPGDVEALAGAVRSVLGRAPEMGAANRRWAEERFTFAVVVPRWARLLESIGT